MKKIFALHLNWAGNEAKCLLGGGFYPLSWCGRVTSITPVKEGKEYKSISKTDYTVCFQDEKGANGELIISGDIVMGVEKYVEITDE